MIAAPAVLLAVAALAGILPGVVPAVERVAARFTDHAAYAPWVLHGAVVRWPAPPADHAGVIDVLYGVVSVAGAVALSALGLFGRPLREALPKPIRVRARTVVRALRGLHSGHIGDYIAWWTAGASVLGGVCLLALR
jgi:multicomponent Na+:H+ antiporter subunit D